MQGMNLPTIGQSAGIHTMTEFETYPGMTSRVDHEQSVSCEVETRNASSNFSNHDKPLTMRRANQGTASRLRHGSQRTVWTP